MVKECRRVAITGMPRCRPGFPQKGRIICHLPVPSSSPWLLVLLQYTLQPPLLSLNSIPKCPTGVQRVSASRWHVRSSCQVPTAADTSLPPTQSAPACCSSPPPSPCPSRTASRYSPSRTTRYRPSLACGVHITGTCGTSGRSRTVTLSPDAAPQFWQLRNHVASAGVYPPHAVAVPPLQRRRALGQRGGADSLTGRRPRPAVCGAGDHHGRHGRAGHGPRVASAGNGELWRVVWSERGGSPLAPAASGYRSRSSAWCLRDCWDAWRSSSSSLLASYVHGHVHGHGQQNKPT